MRQVKINAYSYAQMIKLMMEGTYNCQELANEIGLHYVTVLQYARELYRAGAAHICAWEKDIRGRDVIKVYKLGPGKDAKREKLSDGEKQRRLRAKKKAIAFTKLLSFEASHAT